MSVVAVSMECFSGMMCCHLAAQQASPNTRFRRTPTLKAWTAVGTSLNQMEIDRLVEPGLGLTQARHKGVRGQPGLIQNDESVVLMIIIIDVFES